MRNALFLNVTVLKVIFITAVRGKINPYIFLSLETYSKYCYTFLVNIYLVSLDGARLAH